MKNQKNNKLLLLKMNKIKLCYSFFSRHKNFMQKELNLKNLDWLIFQFLKEEIRILSNGLKLLVELV
uniref:Uncharacterized protein n=1 Tax=Rhizophagus irregularis (strain DAOM 181602 / DAOM 197198 / MUCL 43194) TaxID=747089 RepID=U9T6V7_RHIID